MKVNPRETLLGWGMILLALPVMLIFIGPFCDFGENLNCLITGQDSCNILRMIGSLAIMTVYAYVCLRLGGEVGMLYVTTVMFSGLSVFIWDRGAIITKIIMLAVSAGFFFIPFRLVSPKNNTRKTPRKAVVKYNIRGLSAEQKKKIPGNTCKATLRSRSISALLRPGACGCTGAHGKRPAHAAVPRYPLQRSSGVYLQ